MPATAAGKTRPGGRAAEKYGAAHFKKQPPLGGIKRILFTKRKAVAFMPLDEALIYEILSVVEEIPQGRVATYGQIARLTGREKNARLVGKVLGMAGYYGKYPCHRVVDHTGRLAPGWPQQGGLLRQEGVFLKDETHVDLKRYQWNC